MFGQKRFEKALTNLHVMLHEHKDALSNARMKLYSPDRYGVRDPKKWIKELTYFRKNVLDVRLSIFDKALIEAKWKKNYFEELDLAICCHISPNDIL